MQKGLFKSKIFWLATISFLIAIYQLLTGRVVPDGTAEQIVAIDWSNIAQAIISLLVILARAFFSGSKISGFFGKLLPG